MSQTACCALASTQYPNLPKLLTETPHRRNAEPKRESPRPRPPRGSSAERRRPPPPTPARRAGKGPGRSRALPRSRTGASGATPRPDTPRGAEAAKPAPAPRTNPLSPRRDRAAKEETPWHPSFELSEGAECGASNQTRVGFTAPLAGPEKLKWDLPEFSKVSQPMHQAGARVPRDSDPETQTGGAGSRSGAGGGCAACERCASSPATGSEAARTERRSRRHRGA